MLSLKAEVVLLAYVKLKMSNNTLTRELKSGERTQTAHCSNSSLVAFFMQTHLAPSDGYKQMLFANKKRYVMFDK